MGRPKSIFICLTIIIAASLPATSWADQTCARLLTAAINSNIIPPDVPLKDTPTGRKVYKQLREALLVNPTTFSAFVSVQNKRTSVRDVVEFMLKDRKRIYNLLSEILAELPANDRLYDMVARVQKIMLSGVSGPLYLKMKQISERYGQTKWQPSFKMDLLGSFYMNSYTYLSELITALELRGLAYANVHFYQMLPRDEREKFAVYFDANYSRDLLKYELDAVTVDTKRREMTWFEVKHYSHRVEAGRTISDLGKRIYNLRRLIGAIENNPELRALFPYKFKIRYVIWGAGISPDECARIQEQYGVTVEDRSVQNFNSQFGIAHRSAAGF